MAEANKSKGKSNVDAAQPSNADRLRVIYAAMEEFSRRLTALENKVGIAPAKGDKGDKGATGDKGEAGAQGKQGDTGHGILGF